MLPPAAPSPGFLSRTFQAIIAKRWWVIAVYALIVPPAAYLAAQVGQDNSVDRLIRATDREYIATREFEEVFGAGEYALLLAEADDPLAPEVVERVDRIERALQPIAHVTPNSALSVFRRAQAGFTPTPEQVAAFRRFVQGTELFRRQGLVGDHFLAIALILDVHGPAARRDLLAAIDGAIAPVEADLGPLLGVHRLGQPYVNVYLDDTQRSVPLYFGLFVVFVIALNIRLYHSLRTLAAFVITLGVCLALSVGYIGLVGGTFTLVSPMVPMTILVTATATLVYLHGRFVECPKGRPVHEHHIYALTNKFVACTASIFATAAGFGALTVSNVRVISEMGLWVAAGLALTWVTVFTLFPALQSVLKTPTQQEQRPAAAWFARFAGWLPGFSYRWRWPLVGSAVMLSACGAVALFGVPRLITPMHPITNAIEYMSHESILYQDIKRFEPVIPGLSLTHVWLKGTVVGSVSDPAVLNGLYEFQRALEAEPDVGAVIGPTTILRLIRYIGGKGDGWPHDPEGLEQLANDLDGLMPVEPMLQRFVQKHSQAQTQLTVVSRATEYEAFALLQASIQRHWQDAVARTPALRQFELKTVGLAPLVARVSQSLVPTLVRSFALTVVIIFGTFLVVFRNGTARLMAMIPSLFAILVMFGVMRLTGMTLNLATILIASTVLGTSENDQIHFFYHFLEKRRDGTVEEALRHTLLVAGRAIFFATLINAGGFLAFALSDLRAVRQFGILSGIAFLLSMVADFTALPAALWILFREQPDAMRGADTSSAR